MTAPADTDLMRAEGLKKMARAICCPMGCVAELFGKCCRAETDCMKATAALAAWERHIKETEHDHRS